MSKRKFHGEDELNDFVAKRRKPTFSAFMTRHLKDLPKWSTDLIHLDALELFSRWNRRFAKALIKCEKQHLLLSESSCKFDKERWSTISRIANDLTDVQLEYICGGTKLLREASSSVCAAASTMISSNSTIARDDSEATMGYPSAVARNASVKSKEVSKKVITISLDLPDLEQKVHEIAYDYFSGKGITKARQRELQAIMAMDCGDADCSLALIRLGAKHMLKEKKTAVTQAIIKLSISKIYNLIDSRFEVIYKSNVPPTVWSSVENKAKKMMCLDDGRHLSDDTIKLFDEIVEQQSSTAMLKLIDKKKYLLSSSDNEDTEAYTALLIVEQVVRNFNRHQESDSEATCYRRFAALLEVLLDGTGITMIDGEKACKATKMNNTINNVYFEIDLSRYGRKIDLILCTLDRTEICSNEFKKETSDDSVILDQQSKNLRTNASILQHVLYPLNHELDTTMAIDLIGTNGYLYALQLVNDDFYIAKPVSQLLYPKTRESLWLFLDTLKALFFFKDFLCTTANRAKMELNRRAANNALPTLNTSFPSFASTSTSSPTSSHSSPFIFTSPSHP